MYNSKHVQTLNLTVASTFKVLKFASSHIPAPRRFPVFIQHMYTEVEWWRLRCVVWLRTMMTQVFISLIFLLRLCVIRQGFNWRGLTKTIIYIRDVGVTSQRRVRSNQVKLNVNVLFFRYLMWHLFVIFDCEVTLTWRISVSPPFCYLAVYVLYIHPPRNAVLSHNILLTAFESGLQSYLSKHCWFSGVFCYCILCNAQPMC